MKEIMIVVNKDGSVTIRYSGFYGEACFQEAQKIYQRLKQLGVDVKIEKVVRTPEAYIQQKQRTRMVESNGY